MWSKFDDRSASEFPIGCRVVLPSGNTGTVLQHVSCGPSAHNPERLLILVDPNVVNHFRTQDEVVLQPKLVRLLEEGK